MKRQEFSKKTKLLAFERSGGECEVCTAKLFTGNIEYDHFIPAAFDGPADLENCVVMCRACHKDKTTRVDAPRNAKSRRIRIRQAGIVAPRTITAWRRFDGSIVRAPRSRD